MTKVIIATCDEVTKEIIRHCVHAANPALQIVDGSNDRDILYHLKSAEDDIVFFDKYFLSYVLKFKIKALRVYNRKLRIFFVEQKAVCSQFFGLRIYDLKVDGFISNIENYNEFIKILRNILSGKTYFPEDVLKALDSNEHLRNRKYCSEITELELAIGMYLGEGKAPKEIGDLLDIELDTLRTHINRIKYKIGCETMNDFAVLNRQLEKINYRSWNC
ncbi:MAG: response regulator transcription factor [Treponema sp.]|nr:response regulator transcription factor [Treponema sp.]